MKKTEIKAEIKRLIEAYYTQQEDIFIPGETPVLTGQAVLMIRK